MFDCIRHNSRGQTMVLFALSMLVLVFMVMMTLSLGTRVKERIELQTAADTAAYSSAVMTARTYNTIALLNRVNISHMVSAAGIHALQGWTSAFISGAGELWKVLNLMRSVFSGPGFCDRVYRYYIMGIQGPQRLPRDLVLPLSPYSIIVNILGATYFFDDQALSGLVQRRFLAGLEIFGVQTTEVFGILGRHLDNQRIADDVSQQTVTRNKLPNEINTPDGVDRISKDEAGVDVPAGCQGSICWPPAYVPDHIALAAMGTRGYNFVTGRRDNNVLVDRLRLLVRRTAGIYSSVLPVIALRESGAMRVAILAALLLRANINLDNITYKGSTYWSNLPYVSHSSPSLVGMMGLFLWSDDHGGFRARTSSIPNPFFFFIPCGNFAYATTFGSAIASTGLPGASMHTFTGPGGIAWLGIAFTTLPNPLKWRSDGDRYEITAPLTHRTDIGFWTQAVPPLLDYNFNQLGDGIDTGFNNNHGQPKLFSMVERDYGARAALAPRDRDPWDMLDFTAGLGASGERFSMTSGQSAMSSAALAAGLAYYHRGDTPLFGEHWEEPPNFLNPRWRATLVAPDIEPIERIRLLSDPGTSDIRKALRESSNPAALQVFDAMRTISPNSGGEVHVLGVQ